MINQCFESYKDAIDACTTNASNGERVFLFFDPRFISWVMLDFEASKKFENIGLVFIRIYGGQ